MVGPGDDQLAAAFSDKALGTTGAPPEGLVVHSTNTDGSIRYDGVAELGLAASMTDSPCVAGGFSLRITSVDPSQDSVDVQVLA